MGHHFASLIVHTADTSRVFRDRPPVTGGPDTDYGTGVHVGEDFMLRIPQDREHSDTLPSPLRDDLAVGVIDPCEVGRATLLLQNKAGYLFLATAEDLESVHTRLERPRVHPLPQIHRIPIVPQRSSPSSMYRRIAPPGRSGDKDAFLLPDQTRAFGPRPTKAAGP